MLKKFARKSPSRNAGGKNVEGRKINRENITFLVEE